MTIAVITAEFRIANYVEAALWWICAAACATAALRSPAKRRLALIAAATLVVFGASDIIEAQTGAWYRPLGLLILKGACLAVLLPCALIALRSRK